MHVLRSVLLVGLFLASIDAEAAAKTPESVQAGFYVIDGPINRTLANVSARLVWRRNTEGSISGNLRATEGPLEPISPLLLTADVSGPRLRLRIRDPAKMRWEVPYTPLGGEAEGSTGNSFSGRKSYRTSARRLEEMALLKPALRIDLSPTGSPLSIVVSRVGDDEDRVLFNSSAVVFSDALLSLSSSVPPRSEAALYGLGEHTRKLRLEDGTYVMFNKGNDGIPVDKNLYGTHPFLMQLDPNMGTAHGVLFFSSNAQQVELQQEEKSGEKTSQAHLTWTSIGGIIDVSFYAGPAPKDVLRQYHASIGLPHLPPYFALGFHQCRFGYFSLLATREVVEGYRAADIPLETMWNDIDWMHWMRDFAFDPVLFPVAGHDGVRAWVDELHAAGQHYVVILDPGIATETTWAYTPYSRLLSSGAVVLDASGKEPIWNVVWPGYTIFPDFSAMSGALLWGQFIADFRSGNKTDGGLLGVPVDGLWIDMNEPKTFCNSQCYPEARIREHASRLLASSIELRQSTTRTPQPPDPSFDPDNPPFVPGGEALTDGTVALSARTSVGGLMYNLHDVYGFLEQRATMDGLEADTKKRGLVISRSTFVGSGHHGGHWLGDNKSSWADLFFSIPGMLRFQFFGIPLVGSDICGFLGETTVELCIRWIELGSFYPFARNHNSILMRSQELYALGPVVAEVSKRVLYNRYELLPLYFSLLFRAHFEGGTVVRPLFLEWSLDQYVVDIDEQFLVGSGLLVSPALYQNQSAVKAYLPPSDRWFDYWTGSEETSGWRILRAPLEHINVHVRGGTIIPKQRTAYVLRDARQLPFELMVALDAKGNASGELFWDDGESLNTYENNRYVHTVFAAESSRVIGSVLHDGDVQARARTIGGMKVFGLLDSEVSIVFVNGTPIPTQAWELDARKKSLTIMDVDIALCKPFTIMWQ